MLILSSFCRGIRYRRKVFDGDAIDRMRRIFGKVCEDMGASLVEMDGAGYSRQESEIDTLLTDLVITCCPVGMNRTNTMNARVEKYRTHPIIKEALMMLKQGFGRLMRDHKQTGKHLWFMDGRIWTEWKGMRDFQRSVEAMLRNYPNREVF